MKRRSKPKSRHLLCDTFWTTGEIRYLVANACDGAKAICEHLNELREQDESDRRPPLTENSVKCQAHRLMVTLRQPGSRRGSVLGQPRGQSWVDHPIRRQVLAGDLDISRCNQLVASDVKNPPPLCPMCGKRPQRRTSGLCDACHIEMLTYRVEDETEARHRVRRHDRAKQQVHREAICWIEGCDHAANGRRGLCWTHYHALRRMVRREKEATA